MSCCFQYGHRRLTLWGYALFVCDFCGVIMVTSSRFERMSTLLVPGKDLKRSCQSSCLWFSLKVLAVVAALEGQCCNSSCCAPRRREPAGLSSSTLPCFSLPLVAPSVTPTKRTPGSRPTKVVLRRHRTRQARGPPKADEGGGICCHMARCHGDRQLQAVGIPQNAGGESGASSKRATTPYRKTQGP